MAYNGVIVGQAKIPGPSPSHDDDHDDDNDDMDTALQDLRDFHEEELVLPHLQDNSDEDDDPRRPPESEPCDSDDDERHVENILSDAGMSDSTQDPREHRRQSLDGNVIPPWDAKLPVDQVEAWKTAEAKLGIKRSVGSWLAAKRKALARTQTAAAAPQPLPGQDFVAAVQYAGSVPGFRFGTTDGRCGYHRDAPPQPPAICLADELARLATPAASSGNTKTTRRRRNADGARTRGRSRRWNSLRNVHERTALLSTDQAAEVGWRPPAAAGLWLVDTTNPNSWSSGIRQLVQRSAADILLMQETKLRDSRTSAAVSQARRFG